MKIVHENKTLTSEALNAEMIVNENIRKANENARNVHEEYDPLKTYVKGNKVTYNGSSYICKVTCTGVLPTSSTVYWHCIAAAGGSLTNASQLAITDTGGYYTVDDVNSALQETGQRIGDLSQLQTESNTDLVGAINENTSQIENIPNQTYITEKAKTTDINSALTLKANQTSLDTTNNNVASNTSTINTHTTQIASLASGAPKAVSLVSQMTDTAKNYVYTGSESGYVSGNWYYWNGTAWTSGGVYQSTGIADGSIAKSKLSFIPMIGIKSKNLFDKSTAIAGYYVNYSSGVLIANANNYASDYIAVLANTIYTKNDSASSQLAYYDANKVFISGLATGTTFTAPANAAFLRVTVPNAKIGTFQLELGSSATSYESFTPKLDKLSIAPDTIDKNMLSFDALEAVPSKNLFNKETITTGGYISYVTGTIGAHASYSASDYIPVSANTQYVKSDNAQFAFYDANKVYISGLATAVTFTTPANAAYVRISVLNTLVDTYQLELGSVATGYETFAPKLNEENFPLSLKQPYQNQIVVAKSGGQYATISEAVTGANDTAENPVTILIMPGVYEESVDIRGRYISLVGINRETCIIKNYLADYAQPPINMSGSFNHVANLTVISDKDETSPIQIGSYAIHCDSIGLGSGQSTIRNCTLECVQNAAVGLGTTDKQTIIIDNCDLLSHEKYSLYAHNYQLSGATQQKLIVKNCKIRTKINNAAITIQDANNRTGGNADDARDTIFTFYNNIAWSDVAGKVGMLGGDTALDAESWRGYIKLGADSYGNNISEINVQ